MTMIAPMNIQVGDRLAISGTVQEILHNGVRDVLLDGGTVTKHLTKAERARSVGRSDQVGDQFVINGMVVSVYSDGSLAILFDADGGSGVRFISASELARAKIIQKES